MKRFEQRARKTHLEGEGFSAESIEALNAIDFDELCSIYAEYAERSGAPPHRFAFIGKDVIKAMSGFFNNPGKNTSHGDLYLNRTDLNLMSHLDKWRVFVGVEPQFGEYLLSLLCHEETHAAAGHPIFFHGDIRMVHGGYYQTTMLPPDKKRERDHDFFEFFNEGVTDLIAEEVYDEYLSRRKFSYATKKGPKM